MARSVKNHYTKINEPSRSSACSIPPGAHPVDSNASREHSSIYNRTSILIPTLLGRNDSVTILVTRPATPTAPGKSPRITLYNGSPTSNFRGRLHWYPAFSSQSYDGSTGSDQPPRMIRISICSAGQKKERYLATPFPILHLHLRIPSFPRCTSKYPHTSSGHRPLVVISTVR